jgi:hypothetical protein
MSVEVLKDIRKELKELRLLYKELVEKLIPTEQPTPEERKAIEKRRNSQRKRTIQHPPHHKAEPT